MRYEKKRIAELKEEMTIDRNTSLIFDVVALLTIIILLILRYTKVIDEDLSNKLCFGTLGAFATVEIAYLYGTIKKLRLITDLNGKMIDELLNDESGGDEDCNTNSNN